MVETAPTGILNPRAGAERFQLAWREAAPDLAPLVARHWLVRWDLRGAEPFAQETLPYPCVNLAFGSHQPGVHGVPRARFVAHLQGEGWVLGVRFRPGGFHPFLGRSLTAITGAVLPVEAVFGPAGAALDRAVHAAAGLAAQVEQVEAFLRDRAGRVEPEALEVSRIVALADGDPSMARVDELARAASVSVRALERMFRTYVGVPPKWVIRRARVQRANERVAAGAPVDWAALAQELGYCDQAHFIRDFKAQIGRTPAEYAALCAGAGRRAGPTGRPSRTARSRARAAQPQ